jgi:hypothetical protein
MYVFGESDYYKTGRCNCQGNYLSVSVLHDASVGHLGGERPKAHGLREGGEAERNAQAQF